MARWPECAQSRYYRRHIPKWKRPFAMCLILLAVDSHPQFSLVVAANRDEFYARPTRPLQPWPEAPQLLAGRDLTAGGTWLGLTRSGRFAAVTNARDVATPLQPRSRGRLTLDFLLAADAAKNYAKKLDGEKTHYAGFNLLIGDRDELYYCSNDATPLRRLSAGIYGLANASLDTPWPKVVSGKAELQAALQRELDPAALLQILTDGGHASAAPLPTATDEITLEHLHANRFIRSATYGTRASTVLLINRNGAATLWEQNFSSGGAPGPLAKYQWQLDSLA